MQPHHAQVSCPMSGGELNFRSSVECFSDGGHRRAETMISTDSVLAVAVAGWTYRRAFVSIMGLARSQRQRNLEETSGQRLSSLQRQGARAADQKRKGGKCHPSGVRRPGARGPELTCAGRCNLMLIVSEPQW